MNDIEMPSGETNRSPIPWGLVVVLLIVMWLLAPIVKAYRQLKPDLAPETNPSEDGDGG